MRMPSGATQSTAATRRPPGGPAKGDRRRQAIVDAVERLLRQRTIAELSVESIAGEAGISRSGFYFYFESKYAALGDALTSVWAEMAHAAEDFFGGSDEPPEAYVPRALTGVAELWRRHEALLVGMFEASGTDTGARTLWEAWLERFVEATAERIATERAAGRAPAGPPDAQALARTLLLANERVLYDDRRRQVAGDAHEQTLAALSTIWIGAIWGPRREG